VDTLAATFVCRHTKVRITTERATEFVDITDGVQELVTEAGFGFGLINVQSLHTTASIVVNEHEPLLLADFEALLERAAPAGMPYRHDDFTRRRVNLAGDERPNGQAHCRALLLGTSACLNVVNGRLLLGRWQRVFLVELDGPQPRDISVLLLGEGGR
jgi:secondary thiamine-phosphate synthase enzyme